MKTLLLYILVMGLGVAAQAQKIKLKLTYTGTDAYVGTMDPKWFEVVSMQLPANDATALEGAEGAMRGGQFGAMGFRVEKNLLPTEDALMLRTNNGWYPIEKLKQRGDKLRLRFDWEYRPVPQPVDLEILREARAILANEANWNREDDRECGDDVEQDRFSLYCAMMKASVVVTEDFNHRGAALNLVRKGIMELRPDREYAHRLMDFNNEESHTTLLALLDQAILGLENALN